MNKISDYSISDILQAAGIETKKIGNTTVCRCPICHFGETLKSGQHEAQINDNQTVPTLVCHSCGKAYTRTELIERLDLFDVLKIQKWQEKEGSEKMEQAKKVLEFKTKKQEPEAEKPQRNYADEWKILKPLTKIEKQYLAGRGILDIDIEQVKITNPGYLAFAYHNSNGDVVGYSVRGIYADPETGKKPNYKLIPKNTTIAFNFSNALIKSELADVYIVEGEIDALSMLKMGYNAIAAGGATFLKPELAEIIKNAGKNPIFCADNDEAGRQAIERLPENCNYIFWICDKDTAKDPNDVLVRGLNFSDITEIKKTEPKPLLESQTLKFLVSSIKNKIIDAEDKKNILIQFSKWFEKWQFADTTSPVFCGLDIHSEQIIIFEKSTQKTLYLEKISSLQSLLGIDQGLTLKDAALPPCRIEFNPENSKTIEFSKGLEKFKINTFKKSETRLKAENYATEIQLKSGKLEYNILETTLQSEAPAVWAIISNLFIKLDERRYFLNWLSYIAQTKKKTRNAVIIKGLQGTGKGLLFEKIIRPFFGNGAENPQDDSQVITLSNESLKSEFNGDLENQLFVTFNEVKPDFRDGTTLYEKLKQIISDDFLIVNQKFIKPRQVKNYANCIFFSNNSIPVSVENSDRRYSIFTANTSLDSLYSKSEISDLVDKIESGECVKFWAILLAYNYSSTEALNVFVNDEKEIIQRTTQEWTTIFSDLLIQKKYDKLYDWLFELISFNGTENNYRIENLKKEIDNKYVSSNTAYSLYLFSLFGLSEDPDPEKINSMKILTRTKFSMKISAGLGKIKVIRINSKILRVWQI